MMDMIENEKIIINFDDCNKCGMCIKVCPYNLYMIEDDKLRIDQRFEEECIECGHCVAICPVNIIRLKIHKDKKLKELPKKEDLPNFEQILNICRVRRSIRTFKDTPVPKEIIEKVLDLARYTPTGHNEENIHYTVVQNPSTLKKFSDATTETIINIVKKSEEPDGFSSLSADLVNKIEGFLPGFKRNIRRINLGINPWTRDTCLIIIHSPKSAVTLVENCSLAAAYIMLAAETLGLGTCSLGYTTGMINQFKPLRNLIKIPRKHKVAYSIAIGYPKLKYKRIPARKEASVKWL